jgi:hypothetical protein
MIDDAQLRSAVGLAAASILQGIGIRHDLGMRVMAAVGRAIDDYAPGQLVCWSRPWSIDPVVVAVSDRRYPSAAAKRHGAQLMWIDVDKLLDGARQLIAHAEASGGTEAKAA